MSVGASGFAWSSSPNASGSVNAGNLGFDATVVNPLNNNNRANGFPCAASSIYGELFYLISIDYPIQTAILLRKDAQTRRKTACRPGMAGVKAPASEVRRFRNPLTDRRAACELYIPVCPGVAAELLRNTQSSDCPGCYGQPQQRVGSLGERRHVGRLLRFVASACGQCQREPFGFRFGRPAPAEQREPG